MVITYLRLKLSALSLQSQLNVHGWLSLFIYPTLIAFFALCSVAALIHSCMCTAYGFL